MIEVRVVFASQAMAEPAKALDHGRNPAKSYRSLPMAVRPWPAQAAPRCLVPQPIPESRLNRSKHGLGLGENQLAGTKTGYCFQLLRRHLGCGYRVILMWWSLRDMEVLSLCKRSPKGASVDCNELRVSGSCPSHKAMAVDESRREGIITLWDRHAYIKQPPLLPN